MYRREDLLDPNDIHPEWFGEDGVFGNFNVRVHMLDHAAYMAASPADVDVMVAGVHFGLVRFVHGTGGFCWCGRWHVLSVWFD